MKTKTALLLLPLMAAGCIYIEPGSGIITDSSTQPQRDKPHTRLPQHSGLIRNADGKCLDRNLAGSQSKDIITYRCHGEHNQRFTFANNKITVDGLCLDIAGEQTGDGVPVIAYTCHGGKNQQWYRDGHTIRSALNNKCLDSGKYGNQLRMHRCDGSSGQRFQISRY